MTRPLTHFATNAPGRRFARSMENIMRISFAKISEISRKRSPKNTHVHYAQAERVLGSPVVAKLTSFSFERLFLPRGSENVLYNSVQVESCCLLESKIAVAVVAAATARETGTREQTLLVCSQPGTPNPWLSFPCTS